MLPLALAIPQRANIFPRRSNGATRDGCPYHSDDCPYQRGSLLLVTGFDSHSCASRHRSAPTLPLTAEPPGTSTHVSAAVPEEPENAAVSSSVNVGSPMIGLFLNGLHVEGGNGSLALAFHGLHESARETFWDISCDFDAPRFKVAILLDESEKSAAGWSELPP
ncbi:hypothetical protein Pelo_7735 [Pelomyxa schiedti]|nr:hypothetical protein Pelo_7735 [Pelomyxa schiedti]